MALINQTFTVNGKSYSSPEEMPPEVRALYERALQMQRTGQLKADVKPEIKASFLINGKEAGSLQGLPFPVRWFFSALISREAKQMLQTPPSQSGGNLPAAQQPITRAPSPIRTLVRIVSFALTMFLVYVILKYR
jgi:hypothetical protein